MKLPLSVREACELVADAPSRAEEGMPVHTSRIVVHTAVDISLINGKVSGSSSGSKNMVHHLLVEVFLMILR